MSVDGFSDPSLIRCEVFNPYDFDLLVFRDDEKVQYIALSKTPLGPKYATLSAREFITLPHQYFRIVDRDGEPKQVLMNLGDQIGIGNRKASLPIFEAK